MTDAERDQLEADIRYAYEKWQKHKALMTTWEGRYWTFINRQIARARAKEQENHEHQPDNTR